MEDYSKKSVFSNKTVTGSNFTNCQGVNGGAINIQDVSGFNIVRGNNFVMNNASIAGGAIFFTCSDHKLNEWMCSMNVSHSNIFSGNAAGIEGGAIKWDFYEPSMQMSGITFRNNSAGTYGANIASVP